MSDSVPYSTANTRPVCMEETSQTMSKTQRRWMSHEDAALREHVQRQSLGRLPSPTEPSPQLQSVERGLDGRSINWSEVAKAIPGRSNKDCRKRFFNKVTGGLKKGPWSEDEDTRLEGFVKDYGKSWALIAQKMETRSADQCSKRWHHCLDPKLDHSVWTEQENLRLLAAVERHGTSWKEIQTEYFPSRSANNVKNQFTIIDRKSVKSLKTAPSSALPPQSNADAALLDLDVLDHNLAGLSDMETDHFANSLSFPADDPESSTCPDSINAYSFGSFLDDDSSQLQAGDICSSSPYQMDTTTSSADALRRSSQTSFATNSANSPSSCPLTRLGSQVPSLTSSSTMAFPIGNNSNGNSNSNGNGNSCPNTPPFAADNALMPRNTAIHSNSHSCNTQLTTSLTHLGPPLNASMPKNLQAQDPQHTYPTRPISTAASAPEHGFTALEWPDFPSPSKLTAESDNMRWEGGGNGSGSGTPGKSTRTTITLEDAKPGLIMDVMKVLVGSNTKVRFETD